MELYKSILYEIITVRSYRDVNYKSMHYAATKWKNRIMLVKHLVLETAGIWPSMCYLLHVSTAEMFI